MDFSIKEFSKKKKKKKLSAVIYIYIYIYIYRRSKCGKPNDELPVEGSKPNDELPVEGSREDTVLQCEFVDECKAMDMKQSSNCSGFNVTFRPSAFFRRGTLLIYR